MKGKWLLVMGLLCGLVYAQSESGRGRHKQFYVTPAPGEVTIDGHLDDWDLSGQIEMFVIDATRSTQSARLAAMYDKRAFYPFGDIKDPSPMMNRHDPKVNARRAWDADAVQFRLTIDPSVGYPVRESSFTYRRQRGRNALEPPADTSSTTASPPISSTTFLMKAGWNPPSGARPR